MQVSDGPVQTPHLLAQLSRVGIQILGGVFRLQGRPDRAVSGRIIASRAEQRLAGRLAPDCLSAAHHGAERAAPFQQRLGVGQLQAGCATSGSATRAWAQRAWVRRGLVVHRARTVWMTGMWNSSYYS